MKVHPAAWAVLVALFAAVIGLQLLQAREQPLGLPAGVSTNLLYVRSPEFLRRASLSFHALVADIYWIRTVQHYGSTKLSTEEHKQYDILYPLLDLTTSLDPYFDVAYKFGAIFLAEEYPAGAGRPDQAIAILRKGLQAQPDRWQLAQEVGFVYYWWLHDYDNAATWFNRAADMTKAPGWLRPLAAVTLAQGGARATSRTLWGEIASNADADAWLKSQATWRLSQLDAMDGIDLMERVVQQYRARTGVLPATWADLIRAGLLRGVPADPEGTPLQLDAATGRVGLDPRSKLNPLPSREHPL